MLVQKLGLSLNTLRARGGWTPADESTLEAWYQKGVGITLNGSDVSEWADSSEEGHNMVQATPLEQPGYAAGILSFVSADINNLQTSVQISLADEFTIGFIANPEFYNNVILGDNTTSNEFFKYSASDKFLIKIDGTSKTFTLDGGDTWGDDYIVVTRDSSDVISIWRNGVKQADTETLAGEADIDAIGVRATDVNPFDGTVEEIQIYTSESDELTTNINSYLSGI